MLGILNSKTYVTSRYDHTRGWGRGEVMGGATPSLLKVHPQDHIPPIRGFPKIYGNKNAIISENSSRKINPPPFQNGLCSKDSPPCPGMDMIVPISALLNSLKSSTYSNIKSPLESTFCTNRIWLVFADYFTLMDYGPIWIYTLGISNNLFKVTVNIVVISYLPTLLKPIFSYSHLWLITKTVAINL